MGDVLPSTDREPRPRPNMALLGATLLPAAFLWMEIGRSIPARREYPSLSHHDPVRLLFLCGEHWRLSSAGKPPPEVEQEKHRFLAAVTELKEEFESYRRIAPKAAAARAGRAARDMDALAVVAAVWGDPLAAREHFAHGSAADLPDYAQLRRDEIVQGRTDREHRRAARIRSFERSRRWLDGLMLGLALPAAFILRRSRTRWVARELAPVPIGLAWAAVLWVWGEATIWLASIATGRDVPILAAFHRFSAFLAIPLPP